MVRGFVFTVLIEIGIASHVIKIAFLVIWSEIILESYTMCLIANQGHRYIITYCATRFHFWKQNYFLE